MELTSPFGPISEPDLNRWQRTRIKNTFYRNIYDVSGVIADFLCCRYSRGVTPLQRTNARRKLTVSA